MIQRATAGFCLSDLGLAPLVQGLGLERDPSHTGVCNLMGAYPEIIAPDKLQSPAYQQWHKSVRLSRTIATPIETLQ